MENAADAQALMEKSAAGINAYLNMNVGTPLYFAVSGETLYVIPYGSPYLNPAGQRVIGWSISELECMVGFYWDPVLEACKLFGGILERAPQNHPCLG